jgi:hypothetical protein
LDPGIDRLYPQQAECHARAIQFAPDPYLFVKNVYSTPSASIDFISFGGQSVKSDTVGTLKDSFFIHEG